MDSKRGDFGLITRLGEWEIGRQTGATGLTEIVAVTGCDCGAELVQQVNHFSLPWPPLKCPACEATPTVSLEVIARAQDEDRAEHERAWKARAEGGGSRAWIPI